VNYNHIEKILQIYTLEEVLELNDLTPEDALLFMSEQEFIKLPNPEPLDFEDG
jgi:hypothetical protein